MPNPEISRKLRRKLMREMKIAPFELGVAICTGSKIRTIVSTTETSFRDARQKSLEALKQDSKSKAFSVIMNTGRICTVIPREQPPDRSATY